MNRTHGIAILALVCILLICATLTYFYVHTPRDAAHAPAKSLLATNQTQSFTDLSGAPLDLEQYKGRVRVVNSWASWSPLSKRELVDLDALAASYGSKNVVVIAIDRKESKEQVARFLKTLADLPHIVFAIDVNDTYYKSIGGFAMPETVFYDAGGNIVEHVRGDMSKSQMQQYIDEALAAHKN